MKKDSDSTKQSSRLSKEEIKKWLIDSLVYNENINTKNLNEHAGRAEGYEDTMNIVKEYEDTIKAKKRT